MYLNHYLLPQNVRQLTIAPYDLIYLNSCACCDNYHAPADCEIIKRWLNKCADDSETVNYISAHTKDVSNLELERGGTKCLFDKAPCLRVA